MPAKHPRYPRIPTGLRRALASRVGAIDWLMRVPIARLIRRGNLRLTTALGTVLTFGDGGGPQAALHDLTCRARRTARAELKLGEADMDGTLAMERGSIAELLEMAMGADYGRALRRSQPLAHTLRAWREPFPAHRETVEKLYDAHFVRMWEFYLAASEMAFAKQNMMVMQIQMTKRQGTVRIARGYIAAEEIRLRA
jgi:hypothetical protein